MKRISDRISYIGVNDDEKALFEGLWPLPEGVSYNSYIVEDSKIALIDTVGGGFDEEYLYNIYESIADRSIDYLVINHMEPDHSSMVGLMMKRYPSMEVVANARAVPMLAGYYSVPEDKIIVVDDGDSIDLGSCSLSFHMIPMVHWPETMVTWLEQEGTLFCGDVFGSYGSVDDNVVEIKGTFAQYRDEMIRYYSNIVGKYAGPVHTALNKFAGLNIRRICSAHGPVWGKSVEDVIALYGRLSRDEVERGVCVAYGSMYGNTAAAAEALGVELYRLGIPHAVHDLSGNNAGGLGLSAALRDVFKYETLVVGSPTYNSGIYPPVETFMKALQSRMVRGRRFYAFGSYSWAGASVRLLNGMAAAQNFEVLGDGLSFAHAYARGKVDMAAVARLLYQI